MGSCRLNHQISFLQKVEVFGFSHGGNESCCCIRLFWHYKGCYTPNELKPAGYGFIGGDRENRRCRPEFAHVVGRRSSFGEGDDGGRVQLTGNGANSTA